MPMSDQNGNGNGNGNGKIFDLSRVQDPLLAQIVPAARRRVCLMTRICEAARMFYCYLTDCSLTPGVNSRKGVVKFSDADLGVRFKVNVKTIRNWKRAIESTGEIWLTEKWMKNSFPQTVYNITSIVGQATLPFNADSEDGSLVEDEVFSSNRRRQTAVRRDGNNGKFVCRAHGRASCELCHGRTPPGVQPQPAALEDPQISSKIQPDGKILPPTTAIDCRPPRQTVAAHRGNRLPSPTAIDCRPARQMVAAPDGKPLPSSAANGCRSARQTVADNGESEVRGKSVPEDTLSSLTAERHRGHRPSKQLSGSPARRIKLDAERDFLERLGTICGAKEIANWGGRWRNRYREAPEKAQRVLAELSAMSREQKIVCNAGACANDLWTRFQPQTTA
jgi:hypothetical protein